MAQRVFIIPRRSDFEGMNVQVLDISPNTSQKNNNLDGDGQTCYIPPGMDVAGSTTVVDDAYMAGSLNTTLLTNPAADDTTGGGNDVVATQDATFGLAAYIRERVQPGGILLATHAPATFAEANAMATAVLALTAGNITLAAINAALSTVVAGTDLDGAAGFSRSFGSAEDILRILSGEVYRSPRYIIVGNVANQFLTQAARLVLVAAQATAVTGQTFAAQGAYLTSTENGYRKIPVLAYTEYLAISSLAGNLLRYSQNMTFKNPNRAYATADVTEWKPRAYYVNDAGVLTVIPATGVAPGISLTTLSV